MNKILFLLSIVLMASCNHKPEVKKQVDVNIDNEELFSIFFNDQEDRQVNEIDWGYVNKRDSLRRSRVQELLDSNKVITSRDFKNAAMVFQHGKDSIAYRKAANLMKKSIELDSTMNKWLFAAATDRYLLSIGEPQIYGTQYKRNWDEPWRLGKIDSTKISDAERIKFGVETLAEQKEKVKKLNRELNQKIDKK